MAPRVAIAGTGSFARYLADELTAQGFPVTIMGRSKKPHFENMPNVTSRIVDYKSVDSVKEALGDDTEVLISAILDYTMELDTAQRNLITAATESPKTRRFIPSEFGGNVEDYPDQTPFYLKNRGPSRELLKNQSTLEWTIIGTGWFSDWIVPQKNRHFPDIGGAFPVDLKGASFFIPGAGIEMVDFVPARDAAKGIVELIKAPYGSWDHYVYMSGEKTCWNAVAKRVEKAYPDIEFKRSYLSLTQMIENIINAKNEEDVIENQYGVISVSNALNFVGEKVAAQKEKYFTNMHFRTVQEILDQAKESPEIVI